MYKFNIWESLKKYKILLLINLFLLIIENIFFLILPLFIGYAIDGLLIKEYKSLWILIGTMGLSVIMGTIRRMVDTRIYSKVHSHIANRLVDTPNFALSKLELSTDIIQTINEDIPMFLESLIQIIGTLFILSILQVEYFVIALGICIVIILTYTLLTKHIFNIHYFMNSYYESYIHNVINKNFLQFRKSFKKMYKQQIKLSDIESFVYMLLYTLTIGLMIFVLVNESARVTASTGSVFAAIAYVLQFEEGIADLPYLYQRIIGAKEIINRLSDDYID